MTRRRIARAAGFAGAAGAVVAAALAAPSCQQTAPPASPDKPMQQAPTPEPRDPLIELLITGDDDGYLDACGCDDGQLGGLPRRRTALNYLGVEDGHALVLSNGGLAPLRPGVAPDAPERDLDREKLLFQLLAMGEMHYSAIALTEAELALGRATLASAAASLGDDCPFLATNLVDTLEAADSTQPSLSFSRSVARTLRDRTVAVFAVLAPSHAAAIAAADPHVKLVPMAEALKSELAKVSARAKPWRTVVLARAGADEAKQLARDVAGIDVIVIPNPDGEDAPEETLRRVDATDLVTTGRKGKFVVRYRFGIGGSRASWKAEDVHQELEKADSVKDILEWYRDFLKESLPIRRWYGRLPDPDGVAYVGSDEGCANCHEKAWKTWQESKHAHAWRTLEDQDLPPPPDLKKGRLRNAIVDPECVRCHVTGFGYASGYRGPEHEDAHAPLVNVGCEACHGPAGDHAQRASRGDTAYPGGRAPSVANGAAFALCVRCHDPDNSTQFELKGYWNGVVRGQQRAAIAHGKE